MSAKISLARLRRLAPKEPPTPVAEGASDLLLSARAVVDAPLDGRQRALGREGAAAFFDVRPYAPGDPPRRVDWRLFGRTDRLFVRRFERETQLTVMVVVDASASMRFASLDGSGVTKLTMARTLAAALAFQALRRGDRAGLCIAGGAESMVASPGAARSKLPEIVARLDEAREPFAGESPVSLAEACHEAGAMAGWRGLVIILTDGLEDPESLLREAALLRMGPRGGATLTGRTAGGCDVRLVQILSPDELDPPDLSGRTLVDPETGQSVAAPSQEEAARATRLLHERIDGLQRGLQRLGARHLLVRTVEAPSEALRRIIVA